MQITIKGDPIAKKRPRFARRGKFTAAINDQQTEEGKFLLYARSQIFEMMTGPLSVRIVFSIKRPKSHYGTGKNSYKLKKSAPEWPCSSRQDLDNLAKFALDCLNGEAWEDDRQIVKLRLSKRYAKDNYGEDGPNTWISIEKLTIT